MIEYNEKEIWKNVVGFEGEYIVSNYGNVISLPRVSEHSKNIKYNMDGKQLKYVFRSGYPSVYLYDKYYFVHRLVAQAFIPNPRNFPEVNHKDENPANCHVDNLEWCTHCYNINYGTRTQRAAEKIRISNTGRVSKKRKPVIFDGIIYDSLSTFCERFHENLSTVSRWLNHKKSMPEDYRRLGLSYYVDVEVTI